jgi:hypothetical protein
VGSLERYVYRPPPRTVQTAAPAVAQAAAPGQADSTAAAGPAGAGNAVAR